MREPDRLRVLREAVDQAMADAQALGPEATRAEAFAAADQYIFATVAYLRALAKEPAPGEWGLPREERRAVMRALLDVREGMRPVAPHMLAVCVRMAVSDPDALDEELNGHPRLSIAERRQVVSALSAEGLSQRQIAAVVGVSHKTVDRDLDVSNDTRDEEAPPYDAGFVPPSVSNDTPNAAPDDPLWWDAGPEEPRPPTPMTVDMVLSPHVAHNAGDHEWYTPAEYVAAAREVLGPSTPCSVTPPRVCAGRRPPLAHAGAEVARGAPAHRRGR